MQKISITLLGFDPNRAPVARVGSEATKALLEKLQRLGLDDDIYKEHIHHLKHSISKMYNYNAREYKVGSPNLDLHQKLAWILMEIQKRGLQSGNKGALKRLVLETKVQSWRPQVES